MGVALALPGSRQQPQVLPFAYGTSKKYVNIGTVPFAAGANSAPLKMPKSGFLSALKFTFQGTVTVGTAGTALPAGSNVPLWNLISNYTLSANLGYQYRSLDGESLYVANRLQRTGYDPVTQGPNWQAYNPTSITAQPVNFTLTDMIGLNRGLNFDKYLISCQTLDTDTYLQFQFGAITALKATTEIITAVTGNVTVTGEFYTVPDTSRFALPDTSIVQQYITDGSFNAVISGDNNVNLTPIQGPEYTMLAFKFTNGAVPDPAILATTQVSRVRIFANATDPIMDLTVADVLQLQDDIYGPPLPAGWFIMDFLNDVSLPNAVGPVERMALSTQAYSQLTLDVTTTGTVVAGSQLKLLKRLQSEVAA